MNGYHYPPPHANDDQQQSHQALSPYMYTDSRKNSNPQHINVYTTDPQTVHPQWHSNPYAANLVSKAVYNPLASDSDPEMDQLIGVLQKGSNCVLSRYLPCTDFLVQCQQDLRAALELVTRNLNKRYGRTSGMSPLQFYETYIQPMPGSFQSRFMNRMPQSYLDDATSDLVQLTNDARMQAHVSCEAVKNAFLGGMKEGESWGLRKWMSKHGGALYACNDLEDILQKVQKMDRGSSKTIDLGKKVRNIASYTLKRLRDDIPKAYQEVSSAHPYLPFFHRLEAALQGLTWFDPEDDDVICLDEDEAEVEKRKAVETKSSKNSKKQASISDGVVQIDDVHSPIQNNNSQATCVVVDRDSNHHCEWNSSINVGASVVTVNEDENVPNALSRSSKQPSESRFRDDGKWTCNMCTFLNERGNQQCFICDASCPTNVLNMTPVVTDPQGTPDLGRKLALRVECLDFGDRSLFPSFWDQSWQTVIRLLCRILRKENCYFMLEPDERQNEIVRNPLCFRDIVDALSNQQGSGKLMRTKLNWSMYKMEELLQAIDLVFLNNLATNGPHKTKTRIDVLDARKQFWNCLQQHSVTSGRKCPMPTKRSEKSGFVVIK